MTTIILLAIYIIGAIATWFVVKNWENPIVEKFFAVVFWPCTLILAVIHWLHMKIVE
jgi:hypothetical protein